MKILIRKNPWGLPFRNGNISYKMLLVLWATMNKDDDTDDTDDSNDDNDTDAD